MIVSSTLGNPPSSYPLDILFLSPKHDGQRLLVLDLWKEGKGFKEALLLLENEQNLVLEDASEFLIAKACAAVQSRSLQSIASHLFPLITKVIGK